MLSTLKHRTTQFTSRVKRFFDRTDLPPATVPPRRTPIDPQVIPLLIIDEHPHDIDERGLTRTEIALLTFLFNTEYQADHDSLSTIPTYNYSPYDYGPYSIQLHRDLLTLEERELDMTVYDNDNNNNHFCYLSTPEAGTTISHLFDDSPVSEDIARSEVRDFLDLIGNAPAYRLIEYTVNRHPEYQENLII